MKPEEVLFFTLIIISPIAYFIGYFFLKGN